MRAKSILLSICISLTTVLSAHAQKNSKETDRGYAFEGRNFVISLGSGFFGYSYGHGKLGGIPVMLSIEYGVHRYVGMGIYGGLLDRNPKVGENTYDLTIYTVGIRGQFHIYNLLDDMVRHDLRGDIIDIYATAYVGMDAYKTDIKLPNKNTWYVSGGMGIRAYPFKRVRNLAVFTEFSPVLAPWQFGLNYRL